MNVQILLSEAQCPGSRRHVEMKICSQVEKINVKLMCFISAQSFPQIKDSLAGRLSQKSHLHICWLQDGKQSLAGGTSICQHWCYRHQLIMSQGATILQAGHIGDRSTAHQDER